MWFPTCVEIDTWLHITCIWFRPQFSEKCIFVLHSLLLGGVPSVVGFPHCAWSGEGLFKAPSLSRTNVQRLGLEPGTFWLQTVGSTAPPGPRFHSLLLWVCVNLHKPIWKISSLLPLPVAFAMYMIKTLCSCHEIQIVLLWLSCT